MIVIAEGGRRTTLLLLEDTIEVADVVESAAIANLGHTGGRVYQQTGSVSQTDINHVVRNRLARTHTEETAEGSGRHSSNIGKRLQADLLLLVLVDILLDPTYTHALGSILDISERLTGQQVIILLQR